MATTTNLELVITAKDRASATLRDISKQLNSAASSFPKFSNYFGTEMSLIGKAAKAASVGITAVGAALTTIGVAAVKSSSDYEQSRIAFETMLGSAEKAKTMLKDITKFAKTTPFELPGVVEGSKLLLAYGFAQEDIIPTMKTLGDLSSALNINLSDMAWLYGTTRVQGRLFSKDLYQFTNRGIPLTAELAKQFGIAESEVMQLVEKGKVGFPEVEKAFASMTGQGGRFQDLMIKQSSTFGGVVSNLKDGFGIITRAIVGMNEEGEVREGSLFDRLRVSAANFYSFLEANQDAITNTISSKVDYAVQKIKEWYDSIGGAQGIQQALTALWNKLTNEIFPVIVQLGGIIFSVTKFISEHFDVIWKVIAAYEAMKFALYAGGVIKGIVAFGGTIKAVSLALMGPAGLYAALVAVVAFLAYQVIKSFNETQKAMDDVRNSVSNVNKQLDVFQGKVGTLSTEKANKQLQDSIDKARELSNEAAKLADRYSGLQGVFNAVKDAAGDAWKKIQEKFKGGSNDRKALGGSVAQGTPYVVGEYRPEVFVPSQSGNIRQMSDMQKEVNINFNNVSVRNDQDINEIAFRVKRILNRESEMYQLGVI